MKKPLKSKLPTKLVRGCKCFENWRRNHKPPTRLPKRLWDLAAELAREYGVSRTSGILRLDYNCLKRRIASPDSGDITPAATAPAFLELLPSVANATVECTVECQDVNGARIRIHIKGLESPDLAALSSGLWSRIR